MSLAVVATDTEVGKTVVSAALLHRFAGRRPAYWKPVATGASAGRDVEEVRRLAPESACVLAEAHLFPAPLSPHLAARLAGTSIDVRALHEQLRRRRAERGDRLLVEGIGGVLVPLTDEGDLFADLLAAAELPALLVATSSLGTINHSLLTLEALRARSIDVAGVILVGEPNLENRRAIERFGRVEVLGELPPVAPLERSGLGRAAAGLDPDGRLERWL